MFLLDDTDGFPKLETERLILRPLDARDAAVLQKIWSDSDVMEYLVLEPFQTVQAAVEMIHLLNGLFDSQEGIRWGIVHKETGVLIGTCGFHNYKPEHFRAEIGYELSKKYWGQGVMSEALQCMIQYGFEYWKLNRLEAFVTYGNINSMRVLEKHGFQQEGLLRQYEFARGKFIDLFCYSRLAQQSKVH